MLKTINLIKNFGEVVALDGIEMELKKNQVVALLGPNGAGKTTLMRILTGFLTPNTGSVLYMDKAVNTQHSMYKQKIGYLPENNPLYGYMKVTEYLEYVASLKSVTNLSEQMKEVVKECGLVEVVAKKIETLSKGYKQRVGLAAALLGEPEILILDEPTSGLDPNQALEVRELIKKLGKKKSVLLSTHILPEAKAMCKTLYIIDRGKIVFKGEMSKVKNLEKKFVELTA